MVRKSLLVLCTAALIGAAGCSGVRTSDGAFVTHAESFRIIGFAIPEDDQAAAMKLVPEGTTITNVSSTAADWTSFWGFFGNLMGFPMNLPGTSSVIGTWSCRNRYCSQKTRAMLRSAERGAP